MPDPFADARNWRDRAQQHINEYRTRTGRDGDIWTQTHHQKPDGNHVLGIRYDQAAAQTLKPVVAEAANALFQALDHIIAVAARSAGVESRGHEVSWPWKVETDRDSAIPGSMRPIIEEKLKLLQKLKPAGLNDEWCSYIKGVFASSIVELPFVNALKNISLDGKHWYLVDGAPTIKCVGINFLNERKSKFIDIPDEFFEHHDEFIFYEGHILEEIEIFTILDFTIYPDDEHHKYTAVGAFEAGSRFVDSALNGAEDRFGDRLRAEAAP